MLFSICNDVPRKKRDDYNWIICHYVEQKKAGHSGFTCATCHYKQIIKIKCRWPNGRLKCKSVFFSLWTGQKEVIKFKLGFFFLSSALVIPCKPTYWSANWQVSGISMVYTPLTQGLLQSEDCFKVTVHLKLHLKFPTCVSLKVVRTACGPQQHPRGIITLYSTGCQVDVTNSLTIRVAVVEMKQECMAVCQSMGLKEKCFEHFSIYAQAFYPQCFICIK